MIVCIKTCLKKVKIDVIFRLIQSFCIVGVFVIGYKETELLPYTNTILASVRRFGSQSNYSMYIKGYVIYFPLLFVVAYMGQYMADHYIDLRRRTKVCTALLALLMAFGRIIGDTYYYVVSWDFLTHATRISAFLFIGWFFILWKVINVLFTYFFKCQNDAIRKVPLEMLQKKFGTRKMFFLIWGSFLLCWLPRLILKYPIYIDWDTTTILHDVIVGQKTTGYVGQMYIMDFFLKLGEWIGSEYNALFIYMSMIYFFSTLLYAFIFYYFQQRRVPPKLWYIVLVVVLFFPLTQDWATLVSKDANYAIAVIGFVLGVYLYLFDKDFVQRHKRLFYLVWIGAAFGVVFFRMNGIFLVVPTLLFVAIIAIKDSEIIRRNISKFNKQITLMIGVVAGILVLVVIPKCIFSPISGSDSYIGYALKYYLQGRVLHSVNEIHARKTVAMAEEGCDEIVDILGDDYEQYMSSQYGYGTDWTVIHGMDRDKMNELIRYLIKNDTNLCIEAMIAVVYGHFDFLRGNFYYYGKNEAFLYYDMESWYEHAVEHAKYSILNDSDKFVRGLPILSKLDNVGLYIWLMIIASVFLVMTRGRKIFIVYLPLYITLIGSCLSSYNAYIRMCAPIALSMPLFFFMCTVKND